MAKIKNNRPLTLERLREVLAYNPATGFFTWLAMLSPTGTPGSIAGTNGRHGYRMVVIDGGQYRAARLAWFYVHGRWPDGYLDHANGVRNDDRIDNLREATIADNAANKAARSNTGVKGVHRRNDGLYQVSVMRHGRNFYLGTYKKLDDAAAARKTMAIRLHGEFARELR